MLNKKTSCTDCTFNLKETSYLGGVIDSCIVQRASESDRPYIYGIGSTYRMKFINCDIKNLKGTESAKAGFREVGSGGTLFVEFYGCTINADFYYTDGGADYRDLKFYNCVLNDCYISQSLTKTYAKGCVFNECITQNTGGNVKNIIFDDCRFYNENSVLSDDYEWASILSFGAFKFNFCNIETKQAIWKSNYASVGAKDSGVYKQCIINYDASPAYYGTQKNFTNCTVTGIS